jgi:glycine/D-amino acid oxidase-like deaminating enzyme
MSVLTAKRTPADRPGSGWYEILPPSGPAQELDGKLAAEWVVVGAGFAGLAAARRLTQLRPGDRIVVLDAQRVGFGSAGRNTGFMIDLPHELQSDSYAGGLDSDRKQIAMNRAAIAFAVEAAEEYGLKDYFNPCGKYHGAADARGRKALEAFEFHLSRLGEPYSHLDATDLKKLTGTDYYASGTYTPGTAMIQPVGYIRGLADGMRDRVKIFENSPVTRIETGRPHTIHTPKGRVTGANVILAVNGYLESFALFERRLIQIYLHASMTRAMSADERRDLGGEADWGLIPADPSGTTVRRIKEGRIVIRNTVTYNPSMACAERQLARAGRAHDESFRARFPMLKGVDMEYRWSGQICLSWNSVPAFGEVEDGVYAAGCQNGLGVCKGTLHGMLIADLATGSNEPLVSDVLAMDKPKKLPPEPFMSLGANLNIWWMQRRAGADF